MKTSLVILSPIFLSAAVESLQVAVIGTTGNIGRAVIQQLSKQNIPTRCLLRHDISNAPIKEMPSTSEEVAASLASMNNVTMVKGDVTDPLSIQELVKDCDVIMALMGPAKPNPILSIFPILSNQNAPSHPYMTNYIGVNTNVQVCTKFIKTYNKEKKPSVHLANSVQIGLSLPGSHLWRKHVC